MSNSQKQAYAQLGRMMDQVGGRQEKLSNSAQKVRGALNSVGLSGSKMGTKLVSATNRMSESLAKTRGRVQSLNESLLNANTRMKKLNQSTNSTRSGMGMLGSAVSMTVGMLGYDLVGSIMETTRASLNARYSMQAFASRLNMTSADVSNFQKSLDSLQSTYLKIDMDVVGQQATDMAYRLGLPKESLTDLTETTAIFMDAMQRNGRSAEDSMMAMADAMDGQFQRLKEIGIGQDDLMKNGWSGDINDKTTLLTAMNKALKDQHYDDLAKSVDTLDDAWKVLSINLSNLLEQVLLPLTPVIVDIVSGISDFIDSLKNIPDEGIILGIGAAFAVLGYVITTSLIPAISEAAVVLMTELLPAFFEISIVGAPLWAIVAAVTAIGLAIYEVGKYFGWWEDLPGMFEAIKAGVMRLWEAFINNEHVQDAIKAITSAFQWLYQTLEPVGQWLMKVLGLTGQTGESFDIVGAIIQTVGNAFDFLWNALTPVYEGLVSLWQTVSDGVTWFTNLLGITNQLPDGFNGVVAAIIMIIGGLPVLFLTILTKVGQYIIQGMTAWVKNGIAKAKSFVKGIVNWIKTLPQRVFSYISNTAHRIASGINNWVSNARSGASKVVSGVINYISSIPGKVYNEFAKIPDRIFDAMNSAVSAAGKWGQSVLDAAMNALGIHSPGFIQKRTIAEFENTNKRILNTVGDAKKAGAKFGESIMKGYNSSFGLDLSNQNLQSETTVNFDHTLDVTLDLANVPGGMSESDLASMINNDKFVTAIAENTKFQQADTNMKNRNNRRMKRATGVL